MLPPASRTVKEGKVPVGVCGCAAVVVEGVSAGFEFCVTLPVQACTATSEKTATQLFKNPIVLFCIVCEDTQRRNQRFIKPR